MKTMIIDKLPRILKNKKRLEEALKIKITNRGKEVTIDGEAPDEYIAEQVIDALNFGFPYSAAMSIIKEDNLFEIINIKDYTHRLDLKSVRARIIGTSGKTLKTISELSQCHIELKDNLIGIIGPPENIRLTQSAIIKIIQGSKQSNAYLMLEKDKPAPIFDLGLKKVKRK